MAGEIYWDTSALLKLYAPETDSADYRQLLLLRAEPLAISDLHFVELYYALSAKERRGELALHSASTLFQTFLKHVREGRFEIVSFSPSTAAMSRQVLDECNIASPTVSLRSLDGLHLGAMKAKNIKLLITADIRMQQAAVVLSIQVVSP